MGKIADALISIGKTIGTLGGLILVGSYPFKYILEILLIARGGYSPPYGGGFYGENYSPILFGLYEIEIYRGELLPSPLLLGFAGLVTLLGLIIYAIGKKIDK